MKLLLSWLALSLFKGFSNAQDASLLTALANIPELSNLTTFFQPYQSQLAGLSNITLLAPNNNAFSEFLNSSTAAALSTDSNLLTAILDYHILNGSYSSFTNTSFIPTALQAAAYANVTGGQRVEVLGGANATFLSGLLQNVTVVNSTNFTGGVIHIVDRFLTLPQNASTTAVAFNLTAAVGALTSLDLLNTVARTRDVTLLVPDNAAFRAVGGNLADISQEELTSILEYHMIFGSVLYSTDFMNGSSVPTLQGNNVSIYLLGDGIYFDNARVVFPNVLTQNGVIHIIDRLLNPANTTITPSTSTTIQGFANPSGTNNVPFTSDVATPTSSIATETIASAITSATSTSGSTDAKQDSTTHSNTGAIAGGVVGGVVLVALGVFLFWFLRRRGAGRNSPEKSATSNSSGNDGAAVPVGRKETTKSYHKPELEATTKSYQKSELEAGAVFPRDPQQKPSAQAINEIDTPMSRVRTELSGVTAPQRTTGTPVSPGIARRETSTQEEQRRLLQEQEEEEARLAEIAHQRRKAELEYQKRMAELEHEQRMAELDITAARLRSRNRTMSELEARANPGPGSAE